MATQTPSTYIAGNILAARNALGMSQTALAHAIGHRGEDAGAYISRIESGERVPRVETLVKLAAALGVTMGQLLAKPVAVAKPQLTSYAEKLLRKK
jgi:transcriptional regulator with XRE-family HTH domain